LLPCFSDFTVASSNSNSCNALHNTSSITICKATNVRSTCLGNNNVFPTCDSDTVSSK